MVYWRPSSTCSRVYWRPSSTYYRVYWSPCSTCSRVTGVLVLPVLGYAGVQERKTEVSEIVLEDIFTGGSGCLGLVCS